MGKKMRIFLSVILFGLVMGGGYTLYINQTKETNKEIQVQSSKDEGTVEVEKSKPENDNSMNEKKFIEIDLTKSTRNKDGFSIYFEIIHENINITERDDVDIDMNLKVNEKDLYQIREKSMSKIIGDNKGYAYIKIKSDEKEYLKETDTITFNGKIRLNISKNMNYGHEWGHKETVEFNNIKIPLNKLRVKEDKTQELNEEIMVGDVKVNINTVSYLSEAIVINYEAAVQKDNEIIESLWTKLGLSGFDGEKIESPYSCTGAVKTSDDNGVIYEFSANYFFDMEQLDRVYIKEVRVEKQVEPRYITVDLENRKIKSHSNLDWCLEYFELYDFVEDDSQYTFRIKTLRNKEIPVNGSVYLTKKNQAGFIGEFKGVQIIPENGETLDSKYQEKVYINYDSILFKIDKKMMQEVDAEKTIKILCIPEEIPQKESCKIEINK